MNEPDFKFSKFASLIHPHRRDAVESLIQMRAEFDDDLRLLQEQLATRKKEIEGVRLPHRLHHKEHRGNSKGRCEAAW